MLIFADVGWEALIFAEMARGNGAFRALAAVCAGHKDLLRVIADKDGKDWVTLVPDTITAHHRDPGFTISGDRA